MLPFVILLIFPILAQHIGVKGIDYQKKNRFALFFFFTFLTVLVMLRHESIGNDTQSYIYYFKKFSQISWSEVGNGSLEIGFIIYNKLVAMICDAPQFYLGVSAIAVSLLIYPTYKRLCIDSSLTIVLFCVMSTFVMMFSGVRQMLAIGIGFVAYEFTRKKKLISFIIAVLIAMTVHTSSVMLVFMYPLYHAKITKKWLLVVVPALTLIFAFNGPVFSVMTLIISRFTKYEGGISSTGAYTMLFLFAIFAVFAFVIPDEARIDEETIGLRNLLLLALVIQMFAPLHTLAMRMGYYYIVFIPLLIPKIIQQRSDRWSQVAVVGRHIMVIFFFAYFFISKINDSGNLHVFPYHFFWENV
jgi:hypothetical protein